jgi:hypothetical protein
MGIVVAVITALWFAALFAYLASASTGVEPLDKIFRLSPENFGDFLSGAFAPIAFIWLAYSVWIQKQELSLTRDVMKEQEIALRDSSISNAALAAETKKQNEISIENTNQQHMSLMINNFYEICKFQLKIAIPSNTRHELRFNIGYISSNTHERYSFSGFEIAENIRNLTIHIRESGIKINPDGKKFDFIGFVKVIEEMGRLSNSSDIARALYSGHGFDQVAAEIESMNNELRI